MKNQLASGGTVRGVLEFILEAVEAVAKKIYSTNFFFDIFSPLAVPFRVHNSKI